MSRKLVSIINNERRDTDERVKALRLQAEAWRLLAIIGTHDQVYAKAKAGWLMFATVPFVDGDAVRQFINEARPYAETCGKQSGVFSI